MNGTQRGNRLTRLAILPAVLAGMVSVASCGVAPTGAEDISAKTSALSVNTMQGLLDALTNNPNGSISLTANLNAAGFHWHLGYFAGTLDGGTHSITNLTTSDTIGQAAGMIVYAESATIKNLKLLNINVSGTYDVGGVVGDCVDCTIDNVAVEGALTAPNYAGGIVGGMTGGSITKSYFKGTVTGGAWGAGGLVGLTALSYNTGDYAYVMNSYAQAANQTSTLIAGSTASGTHPAGGIVGGGSSMWVEDVYAIGTVIGRGSAGGLIGQATCDGRPWLLYRGIYRGNVTDVNFGASPAGWAGTLGKAVDLSCAPRTSLLYFNNELDKDSHYVTASPVNQRSSSGAELTSPTAPGVAHGGIFCPTSGTIVPCGDDPITSPPWDFGTASQNNVLTQVTGPNTQIR